MSNIKTPYEWIIFGEVGRSSRTIWGVLTGAITTYINSWEVGTPRDIDDFGRCYKLITLFPDWKERLSEVAAIFPRWIPFVREWQDLEKAYRAWCTAKDKYIHDKEFHPRLAKNAYNEAWFETSGLVRRLDVEGMKLDGWVQKSTNCWEKQTA